MQRDDDQVAGSTMLSRLQASLADRYRIERELGRGGMATVFLAHDLKHDRPIALKVLHAGPAQALGAERFLREVRLSARLQHPHILAMHDSGDADGQLWFTMPYVEGETLRSRLLREKQLPVDDALRITREVADALHYAHQHGVIHRDIKPENILLSGVLTVDEGLSGGYHALVADFGIARAVLSESGESGEQLTGTGVSVGTPLYMSPEQASAERELDARTDVYSLGCVLYEMLTGEPPYTGPTVQAVLAKRLTEPVPHLRTVRDVPAALERAVTKALARAPADRFSTAAEFADALQLNRLEEGVAHTDTDARPRSRWRIARPAAIGLALLLMVLGGYAARRWAMPSKAAPAASAAVLPFVDLSPEKDQQYFSDGLTEELITTLSQVPGLRVAARTSSFQFKGQSPDVHDVGRKLGVGAVLEGTVRKSGNRLRVSAHLINVKDGFELWSQSYDRDLADVFAVQEDVARSIVAALRLRLGPVRDAALAVRPTGDLQAYDLFLKGRFAWNQRNSTALREAVRYLEQAVTRDSTFARAWAALADAYILVVPYSGGSPTETWRKAQDAAGKALALDSSLAEAHTSLGYGNMIYAWNWPAAEMNFQRAIAADSNYATGHQWYGDFLAGRGRLAESLAEMTRAHQLDPLSRQIGAEWGWVSYLMHRNDEAAAHIRQTLELDPNFGQGHFRLGLVQIQQRLYPEAIASFKRAIDLGTFYPYAAAGLAFAYAASGNRDAAREIVNDLKQRSGRELVPPFSIAVAYAGLGDTSQGIEWLNRGIDQKDIYIPENFFDLLLDPLRKDPRFGQVLTRMGLK
jgi:TolB-like protein/Tfp pilus assembly protein PilF/tRNA A-37 threonylcarbamoyl transferase component Bud32